MPTSLPPVDPNTPLPPAIAAQAAAADAAHKAAYNTPDPAPAPVAPAPVALEPQPQPVAPPAPVAPPQPEPAPTDTDSADQWRHRYLSMEGRYKQAAQTIGGLQEQMQEIGDELVRTQAVLRRGTLAPENLNTPAAPPVSEEDVKVYGQELLDVISRVARQTVQPDLQSTQSEVRQVNQRVMANAQADVHAQLSGAVPNWVEINRSPRFKAWCGLRDVYSGEVRGKLLQAAFQAANAPRVIAFFNGFLSEEQATGQRPDPAAPQPAPQPPRVAAVPLETLTAPGRAKPASGDSTVPADKPVYTRAQIAAFYANVRRGLYAGRDQEKAADEALIFGAQRDGRVRG